MINFFTGLALMGAVATAIACAIAKLIIKNGKSRIEDHQQFSILHSTFSIHTTVFIFFATIATLSAQKSGTNAQPRGAGPPNGNVEWRMGNGELPVHGDGEAANLSFTAISISSNSVMLSLAWPTNFLPGGSCIDFFAKAGSLENRWEWVGCHAVAAAETNFEVEVLSQQFSPSATNMPTSAFFFATDRASAATTMDDWDGDGIPDVYELHNGTNPYVPDGELVPRLTVGVEGGYSDIAAALSASTDYSIVELSAGEHVLPASLVMPDHPVILTGPDGKYAVLRSDADIAVVMLDCGQSAETLFRNIYLAMSRRGSYQAGFWVGGNLPWSGAGASPTFENVRIRAMYPNTLYYGWHYYRDDGGTSLISNCVVNAAGATDVIGVYSRGGPNVSVAGCHFVNFPATNGCYATYFQDGTNIVAEYASPEPRLSWAGYPTNGCYSADVDSDGDGISDHDEVFAYNTDMWLTDSDGDGISDGAEVADGTNPRDLMSFFRHATVVMAVDDPFLNTTNYLSWGTGADGWSTNGLAASASFPSTNALVIASSNDTVYVKAYRDMNHNGAYDSDAEELQFARLNGNPSMIAFRFSATDTDGDGVPDWWETLHADAGLSPTSAADALLDPDGDGLISLHEYWADCDPLIPDGSNTVLSIMARSVDEKLINASCSCLYTNYSQTGVLNGLFKDPNVWAYDIDLSCASPWNGWHANHEAGVLITRRHVLFAKHYLFQQGEGDRQIYFRPQNGGVYVASIIATNVSSHTDIAVALLSNDVPETVSLASILPSDYAEYISTGNGLPMLTLDSQEKPLVHDVVSLPENEGNVSARYPINPLRAIHAEPIVVGDSGNPRFFLIGTTPILISMLWTGPNSPASGPFLTAWRDEIQALIDELTCDAGLSTNSYRLTTFDFSQYQKLPEERR